MTGRQNWGAKKLRDAAESTHRAGHSGRGRRRRRTRRRTRSGRGDGGGSAGLGERRHSGDGVNGQHNVVRSWDGVVWLSSSWMEIGREGEGAALRRAGRGRDARGSPRPMQPLPGTPPSPPRLLVFGVSTPKFSGQELSRHPLLGPGDATACTTWRQGALVLRYLCLWPPPIDVMRRHSRCRICLLCLFSFSSVLCPLPFAPTVERGHESGEARDGRRRVRRRRRLQIFSHPPDDR